MAMVFVLLFFRFKAHVINQGKGLGMMGVLMGWGASAG